MTSIPEAYDCDSSRFLHSPPNINGQGNGEKLTRVVGHGGAKIAVFEYGDPAGPEILFVHGLSQSHRSWSKQYQAPEMQKFRMVVIDLRGHGVSEAPDDIASYNRADVWADDINAVIKAMHLTKPTVVAWSFGGTILCDYVRKYGDRNLGSIVFVGAATKIGPEDAKEHFGSGMSTSLGMLNPQPEINIPATIEFIKLFTRRALPSDDFHEVLSYNRSVSSEIRSAMLSRIIDGDDVLTRIRVPTLIAHGENDTIMSITSAWHIASKVKPSRISIYSRGAHAVFMDFPERFNLEIAEMVTAANLSQSGDHGNIWCRKGQNKDKGA